MVRLKPDATPGACSGDYSAAAAEFSARGTSDSRRARSRLTPVMAPHLLRPPVNHDSQRCTHMLAHQAPRIPSPMLAFRWSRGQLLLRRSPRSRATAAAPHSRRDSGTCLRLTDIRGCSGSSSRCASVCWERSREDALVRRGRAVRHARASVIFERVDSGGLRFPRMMSSMRAGSVANTACGTFAGIRTTVWGVARTGVPAIVSVNAPSSVSTRASTVVLAQFLAGVKGKERDVAASAPGEHAAGDALLRGRDE